MLIKAIYKIGSDNFIPVVVILLFLFRSSLFSGYVNGVQDFGYSHGCSDAQIPNPVNRYINQPEKVSSHHSDAFMESYLNGFKDCSNLDSGSSGNNSISNNLPPI